MIDNHKLTLAELEEILDAARHEAELKDRLEEAYHRADLTQMLVIVKELLGIKQESIQ